MSVLPYTDRAGQAGSFWHLMASALLKPLIMLIIEAGQPGSYWPIRLASALLEPLIMLNVKVGQPRLTSAHPGHRLALSEHALALLTSASWLTLAVTSSSPLSMSASGHGAAD